MGYKVTYDDIELDKFMGILKVRKTVLPPRENYSKKIPSIFGETYTGFTYGARNISLDCYITAENFEDHMEKIRIIANILNVKEPKKLIIGDEEDKFNWAVIDGEFEVERVYQHGTFTINFVCYDPFSYATETQEFIADSKKIVTVENSGSVPTKPLVQMGFQNDAHFVQITNYTGETVLIGERPTDETPTTKSNQVIYDQCAVMDNWSVAGNVVDNASTTGATMQVNAGGYAFICTNFGTATEGWHGASYRRNIGKNIRDFKVDICMEHNSQGDVNSVGAGSMQPPLSAQYEVSASSTILRTGRGTNFGAICTLPKGQKIYVQGTSGGWARTVYQAKTGYVNLSHCKLVTTKTSSSGSGTTNTNLGQYIATANVNVRTTPNSTSGKIITTAKKGTTYTMISKDSNGWFRCTVDGKTGYTYSNYWKKVSSTKMSRADDTTNYSAENKMGKVEAYGFDRNGKKLFKFTLCDNEKYVEYTKPSISIGNEVILQDTHHIPAIKTKTEKDSDGKQVTTKIDSGKFGNWNDLRAWFRISRTQNEKGENLWNCRIERIDNGKMTRLMDAYSLVSPAYPTEELNHIVIFFGQYGNEPVTDIMTVKHVNIYDNTPQEVVTIPPTFSKGDELMVDFEENKVYLNDRLFMEELDIGSEFFDNPVGESEFIVVSDDEDVEVFARIQEKWL